jgi:hypothetical protein
MPLIRLDDGYRPDRDGIYFQMKDGTKNVTCCVKYLALKELGQRACSQDECMQTFAENRSMIETIAAIKYETGYIQDDSTVIVTTRDLNPEHFLGA